MVELINCENVPRSIVSLNMDTSFTDTGSLLAKILILKVQICLHVQTRALAFSLTKFLKRNEIKNEKKHEKIGAIGGF